MTTTVMLRISTAKADHDQVVALLPQALIAAKWRKGERDVLGRFHQDSGVNIELADCATAREAVLVTTQRISKAAQVLRKVSGLGAEIELDFGMELSDKKPMMSVVFAIELLEACASLRICLKASAYACSDSDSDDDD